MRNFTTRTIGVFGLLLMLLIGCKPEPDPGTTELTIDDEVNIGLNVQEALIANTSDFPILDRSIYPEVYAYIDALLDLNLESNVVKHADDMPWEIHLVNNKNRSHAFSLPGGKVFIYVGLLSKMTSEHELAALIGYQLSLADDGVLTKNLQDEFGLSLLLDLALSSNLEQAQDVGSALENMELTIDQIYDADKRSVDYLCASEMHSGGIEHFLSEHPQASDIEWISSSISPASRIASVNNHFNQQGCAPNATNANAFAEFYDLLP